MLADLPLEELESLRPALERLTLRSGQVLVWPDEPITHVYFPIDCVVSTLALDAEGNLVEAGITGREGLVGLPVFLPADSEPFRSLCQVPGDAWRVPTEDFRRAARPGTALVDRLFRYLQARSVQTSQGVLCHRLHPVDERCARWLLLVHDRVDGDEFHLTHEFLGHMLAARRASVTTAMGVLQRAGLLDYRRGRITVLDRAGLEAASCECYQIITKEYERLMGGPSKRSTPEHARETVAVGTRRQASPG